MRLARHVVLMVWESIRFGFATRKVSIIAVVVLGLLLLALTISAQAVAPLVLYPFA